jgi:crotonobetainyl-CoA:carnitine CoA-transferase CaiB-like acyl-CoA transferase
MLELDNGLAGAYCGHLLALLGADVIKIESPRHAARVRLDGPFLDDRPNLENAGSHIHLDARKRSVVLDVSTASGGALLEQLATRSDALLDDGVLGLAPLVQTRYEEMLASNSQLVLVALSPYGLTGPKAHYRSSELCDLAASGWLTQNLDYPDRPPLMPGTACGELGVGTIAALGALLALAARRRTGHGQLVDVSRQEALLSLLAFPTALFAWRGVDGMRMGDRFPFAILPCADGHLGISILTQRHWESLCQFIDREDLLTRADLADSGARSLPEAIEEITRELANWFADKPTVTTFEAAQAARVPVSIIPSPLEVLNSRQYEERGYWLDVESPLHGALRLPGVPYRASRGTFAPYSPAPQLGQHTEELLRELELSVEERSALVATGVARS